MEAGLKSERKGDAEEEDANQDGMEEDVKKLLVDELRRRQVKEKSTHITNERHLLDSQAGKHIWDGLFPLKEIERSYDLLFSECGI